MHARNRFLKIAARCIVLGATLLLVAGCAAISPAPGGADVEDRVPGDAQQAYEQGAYREAARLWQQQAIEADPSEASRLRVYAADAWLLADDTDAAEDLLPWIEEDRLEPADSALLNLLRAQIAMNGNRPVEARRRLDRVGSSLPGAYSGRYAALSNRVESALGTLSSQSVQQASKLAEDIQTYDAEAALALMFQAERIPSSQLEYLATLAGNPERAAWFDLAAVIRRNLVDPVDLEDEVQAWEMRHPVLDVSAEEALDLWLRYRQHFRPPAHVAVLLPATGGLGAAGSAIRDGLMTAFLEQPAGSEVRFYNTGEATDSVLAAYFEAADAGAEWIIGPLDRASIQALLNLAGLATPVLALNDLPDDGGIPPGLAQQVFGISLSQEREAAAVARRMAAFGYENVIVLAPENTWGDRIAGAFRDEFLHDGRQILTAARYLPEENDHSQVLERALQIDESKARKQQLENRLGIELEFEPVRRLDVDAIFLAAGPEQGRLLAPQLRFFDAGDIPTFATSRVYTGRPDAARNQDLDGLNVPLTEWQIDHPMRESIPPLSSLRGGEFASLFAIGMDAWNVLPWLDLMRSDPEFRFPGQSGTYSLATDGNLRREPAWGRFIGGLPVEAATPDDHTRIASRAR